MIADEMTDILFKVRMGLYRTNNNIIYVTYFLAKKPYRN
jgi:hypothetical protein